MASLPDTQMRRIRNIDLCSQELSPLLPAQTLKLPGATLNAYGALLQDAAFHSGTQDFCFFSSWIPAMASGEMREGGYKGTIDGHVLVTCDNDKEKAETWPRWAIPLIGGDPSHWVLGWLDLESGIYGIVDSLPELKSHLWATPLFQAAIHRIATSLDMALPPWEKLTFTIHSPSEEDCQIDSWSCGLFVMIAMQAFADRWSRPLLGESAKEHVRAGALDALLNLPADPATINPVNAAQVSEKDTVTPVESDDDEQTPRKPCKHPCQRRARTSASERQQTLEEDEFTLTVEPNRVRCGGCCGWVKLHKKRQYDIQNWTTHREKCSQLTGVLHRRTGAIKNVPVQGPQTPSIINFFQSAPHNPGADSKEKRPSSHPEPWQCPCQHLRGGHYEEYVLRTQTRSLGGISSRLRTRVARQLFPYKQLPPVREKRDEATSVLSEVAVPLDGNREAKEGMWTRSEHRALDHALKGWARWNVDYDQRSVKSTRCEGVTENRSGICDACERLDRKDMGLKKSVYRKRKEAELPEDEQRLVHVQREKFAPYTFRSGDARDLQAKMNDPLIFSMNQLLDRNDSTTAFLELFKYARDGKLSQHKLFGDICVVLAEQVHRATSSNAKAKHGIRYPQDYLHFMTVMQSYGHQSAQNYAILTSQLGGPSPRTLRLLVKKSPDCLSSPDLDFENVAHVKRLMDVIKYHGPVAFASDCTKVRKRLSYSNDFGSHVLGSVFSLSEASVEDTADIEEFIGRVNKEKALATQTRAILVKVPLPQVPPLVIALLPTKGNDDTISIHKIHMSFLAMARHLEIKIISMAADGASSELGAQALMDSEQSTLPPLVYEYPLYGIRLRAPVFEGTGPLISIQDSHHARKTCRNQPQHGTHTASLGRGFVVNRSLLQLQDTQRSGLMRRDVENVDKQDDGAARRLFHHMALTAMTYEKDGVPDVLEEFRGLFVYNSQFAALFEAWDNKKMPVNDRVLNALRTKFFMYICNDHIDRMARRFPDLYKRSRSFISPASFNIFNRLCDSLILLVLAYSQYYPDQPFCPWLLSTEFVEHFFGLARTMLPDFTYAEFLKLHIILSGKVSAKKERTSRSGYVIDYDATLLTPAELQNARVVMPIPVLNRLVELAFQEASAIAKQLLYLPVPKLPLDHIPLQPPPSSRRRRRTTEADLDTDTEDDQCSDSDSDSDDVEADDEENEERPDAVEDDVFTSDDVHAQAEDAALHTARYSKLSHDFDETLEECLEELPDASSLMQQTTGETETVTSRRVDMKIGSSKSSPTCSPSPGGQTQVTVVAAATIASKLLDSDNKISISRILDGRREYQSRTSTHTERIIAVDPKFSDLHAQRPDAKMSIREASHYVRVVQDFTNGVKATKTAREYRWQEAAKLVSTVASEEDLPNFASKNVNKIVSISPGGMVIMKNKRRMYLGEVLDVYKKVGRRHGSIPEASSLSGLSYISLRVYLPLAMSHVGDADDKDPDNDLDSQEELRSFSSRYRTVDLFTHAPAANLVYNLGPRAANSTGTPGTIHLKPFAATRWCTLAKPVIQHTLANQNLQRIPSGPAEHVAS
ncbi:hypothetical protein LXA43DRAFT_977717 [Ganoderma leucocontextum]|nr:hypothetical protein LXA43DRAFT_977717 [Ganoderma leucocontextum]